MLLIGAALSHLAGVVVILPHAVPDAVAVSPQPERGRVDSAVVAGDDEPVAFRRSVHYVAGLGEHGIDLSVCRRPLSQHKPLVKCAGVQPLITAAYRSRQRGIVRHGEVEVEGVFFRRFADPLPIEPMVGVIRIAIEPKARTGHTAPCHRLFHKGTWHQRHLIQKYPAQRHALDQCGGALVPSAEEVEAVGDAGEGDVRIVLAHPFQTGEPQTSQQLHQRCHDIAFQRRHRLSAQGEAAAPKRGHRPAHKADGHGERLSRPHSAIADDGIISAVPPLAPPAHGGSLFGGKAIKLHRLHPPFRPAPPAARQPHSFRPPHCSSQTAWSEP